MTIDNNNNYIAKVDESFINNCYAFFILDKQVISRQLLQLLVKTKRVAKVVI